MKTYFTLLFFIANRLLFVTLVGLFFSCTENPSQRVKTPEQSPPELFASTAVPPQYVNPTVKWELTSKQVSDNEFDLKWTAIISPGFHLYSGYIGEGGPIPTSF